MQSVESHDTGEELLREWIGFVGTEEAARQLLELAAGGTPDVRVSAFGVVAALGTDAAPALRAALDTPLLRAHALVLPILTW